MKPQRIRAISPMDEPVDRQLIHRGEVTHISYVCWH